MAANAPTSLGLWTFGGGSDWVSGTVIPQANALHLLTIVGTVVTGNAPTPTGLGMTWVLVNSDTYASGTAKVWVYRGLKSAGLSTGAVTVSWSGAKPTGSMSLDVVTGIDTSGADGAGAVVTSARHELNGAGMTVTVTAPDGGLTWAAFGVTILASRFTAGPGYTKLDDGSSVGSNATSDLLTEYKLGSSTSAVATWNVATFSAGIALAIKGAPQTVAVGQATEVDSTGSVRAIFHGRIPILMQFESDGAQTITPVLSGTPPRLIKKTLAAAANTSNTLSAPGDGSVDLELTPFTDPCC